MAKVIEPAYKFKPIKCSVCGCTYEYEEGDKIEVSSYAVIVGKPLVVFRTLCCPICSNENTLELEGEEENEE